MSLTYDIIQSRCQNLLELGDWIKSHDDQLQNAILQANRENPWFTIPNIALAIEAISQKFLAEENLRDFVNQYDSYPRPSESKIGIIAAGNLPLVSFHDILCAYLCGHRVFVKCSSKDSVLTKTICHQINKIGGEVIYCQDTLKNMDAYIATGSNNAALHFEYYFRKYPHIIRKNRNSMAILTGSENDQELLALGRDVFTYFGLGCRNVSLLMVPVGYSFDRLLELWQEKYAHLICHAPYKNNYDYNYALLLLNKVPFLMNGAILLVQSPQLSSRIASLHYHHYDDVSQIYQFIEKNTNQLQCIVASSSFEPLPTVPFGQAQFPGLFDFADQIDTMHFLLNLNNKSSQPA